MSEQRHHEYILFDSTYLTSLIKDINSAAQSIDFEVYIFEEDTIGAQVVNALCNAAKRGVQIRVLVDGIGTPLWGGEITKEMETAGIKTRVFHPLPWLVRNWNRSTHRTNSVIRKIYYLLVNINSRNHRKICIIDKKIVYVGSANITNHLESNLGDNECWRENTIKLVGVPAYKLQFAFDKAWGTNISLKYRLKMNRYDQLDDARFRLNYSWRIRRKNYQLLLHRINSCKKRIWVTNAYFVPDDHLLRSIIAASKRGVDVRILLPHKSDVLIASMASFTFYLILIKHGISIYEYQPTMLHAKLLIIDDWYSIGSSNLNYRSLRHDLEVDVNVYEDNSKKVLEKQFLKDLETSKLIVMDDINNQSFIKKILGYIVLLARYWI